MSEITSHCAGTTGDWKGDDWGVESSGVF